MNGRNGSDRRPKPGNHNGHRPGRWQVRVLVPGLPLQSTSVLLSSGREQIVVDTGFSQHDALLLDALKRVRVTAEEVTGVINTHYHLDHCGGNFLFPRAWVYGSRLDFDWSLGIYDAACSGETRREVYQAFYPEAGEDVFERMDEARVLQLLQWMWDPASLGDRSRYRWWEEQELGIEGLRIVPTPGHTPGHLSLAVEGVEGPYMIAGDARPFADDNGTGYDMPPHSEARFLASRRKLDRFVGVLIPGHDDPVTLTQPAPALAEKQK